MSTDAQIFVLNQKIMSFSGDLWIEDGQGNRAFEVDGKAFSVRRTLQLLDPSGTPLYQIAQSLAHVHRTFEIKRGDTLVASIQEALFHLLGDRFTIALAAGGELSVKGDFINREFRIAQNDADVIVASRKLLSVRDSYSVQVSAGFEPALALAIVIALEQMEREEGR